MCCCPLAPHSAWTVPPSCPCLRDTPTVDRCPVRRLHPVHRRCLRPSRRVLHRLPCRRRRHQFRRHCRSRRLLCRRFPRLSLLRPHFFRHRLCLRRRCVELSTDIARACCSHRLRGGTLSIREAASLGGVLGSMGLANIQLGGARTVTSPPAQPRPSGPAQLPGGTFPERDYTGCWPTSEKSITESDGCFLCSLCSRRLRPRRLRRRCLRLRLLLHRLRLRRRCVELSTDIARLCCSHRLRGGTLSTCKADSLGWVCESCPSCVATRFKSTRRL